MRRFSLKTVIQYVIFLGLGLGLVWYSGKDLTPEQMQQLKDSFRQTRFIYMVPVVVALLLSHLSRAVRWNILMQPLGYHPALKNTYLTVLLGYFFNLLMPRLGEVMKCTILARYEKIAPDKLVGTIVAERALDLVCLLMVTVAMVIIQFDTIGSYTIEVFASLVKNKQGQFSIGKAGLMIGVLVLGIMLIRYIFRSFGHVRFVARISQIWQGIWAGLTSIRYIQRKKAFFLHTIIIWILYLLGIWLGFLAFPQVSHLGWRASVSLLVFGSLGMIATQGGIGAYQIAVQKTLTLYGITAVAGLAFGWVMWAAQTAIVLVSGILAIILLPILNQKKQPHEANNSYTR